MLLKDISYLELWWPLSSVEQNHLCNFGRVHHEEQFCEIILNLDQEMSLNFLSRAVMAPLFSREVSFVQFWKDITRKNSVKLF